MAKKEIEALSYEDAVAQIEALLSQLEQSDLPLEEAIKQFEHGTKLIKHCEKILSQTEQKIVGLTGDGKENSNELSKASSAQSSLDLNDDIPF